MAVKNFILNPTIQSLSKDEVLDIEQRKVNIAKKVWGNREQKAKEQLKQKCNLTHTFGRVICMVDMEAKNYHTFQNGIKIRRERQFNEFNRRITQPAQAIVISGEGIPNGSEILIAHNSTHDTNKIFSYKSQSSDIQYFSIPEYDCFAWRSEGGQFKPMKNFEFGLRVYRPYQGTITAITPATLTDVLYITTGSLQGKIVHTLKASDYEIIYQNEDGREGNLIRIRHSDDPSFDREEIQAISNSLTDELSRGTLKIGTMPQNCKTLKEYYGKDT